MAEREKAAGPGAGLDPEYRDLMEEKGLVRRDKSLRCILSTHHKYNSTHTLSHRVQYQERLMNDKHNDQLFILFSFQTFILY